MLTIKHIEVSGHENIHSAVRVAYHPRRRPDGTPCDPNTDASDDLAPCVFIDTPKGDTVALGNWGAFYVMNDAGRTVAKYDLGGWPPEPEKTYAAATWSSDQPDSVRVTR